MENVTGYNCLSGGEDDLSPQSCAGGVGSGGNGGRGGEGGLGGGTGSGTGDGG